MRSVKQDDSQSQKKNVKVSDKKVDPEVCHLMGNKITVYPVEVDSSIVSGDRLVV